MIIKKLENDKRRLCLTQEDRKNLGHPKSVAVKIEGERILISSENEWKAEWENALSGLKGGELRKANRAFFSSVFIHEIDKHGRVSIPKKFINIRKGDNNGNKRIIR